MGDNGFIGIGTKESFGVIVEKKGLFNYYEFYELFSKFFKSFGYDFNEKEFATKPKPQGKDYVLEYEGERKVTDYLKFYIAIRVEIRGGKTLNIETDKKQKGHIIIRFKAWYEKDYRNKWKVKLFKKVYEDYIVKEKIQQYEGKLWAEANTIITKVKKSLGLMERK